MRTFSLWMMAFVFGVAESPALASGIEECVGTSADADHVAVNVDNAPASEVIAELIRVNHLRVDGVDRISKAPVSIHFACIAMLDLVGVLAGAQEPHAKVKRDADGIFHIAIDEGKMLSPAEVETAQHLREYAEYNYCYNREYEKARPLLERMLRIEGKPSDTADVDFVMTEILYDLIEQSRRRGQLDLAIALYGQVIMLHEKHPTSEPVVADDLDILADLYLLQRKYSQAEKLALRALAIHEKAEKADRVAAGLNRLAGIYLDQRRYKDAEPLLKRALGLCEKEPQAYIESVTLENLADLYKKTGRPAEAASAMKRADAIKAKLE